MNDTTRPLTRLGSRAVFLIWGAPRGSHRSKSMVERLGIDLKYIYFTTRRGKFIAPLKYLCQTIMTLIFLVRKRYQLVFIQDPPIFAVLPAYLCSLFSSTRFVIDAHTPPLTSPAWAWTLPLHRFLSRRAITTIVTNDHLQKLVASWGAHAFVLEDPPIKPDLSRPMHLEDAALNIAVVSLASPDEPIEEVLGAARNLPDMHFYITGDFEKSYQHIIDSAPPNAHFMGYLKEEFFPLLDAADVVLDLCVDDHQFLSGANEALWLGKPLVTSKGTVLESYFNKGTIHVDNTAEGIRQGLLEMQKHLADFQVGILALQDERRGQWYEKAQALLALIQENTSF